MKCEVEFKYEGKKEFERELTIDLLEFDGEYTVEDIEILDRIQSKVIKIKSNTYRICQPDNDRFVWDYLKNITKYTIYITNVNDVEEVNDDMSGLFDDFMDLKM